MYQTKIISATKQDNYHMGLLRTMKYTVKKLDKRYSYQKWFKYYIEFSSSMYANQGPLHFTQMQKWCFQTWGWSAEVRQWHEIYRHYQGITPMKRTATGFVSQSPKILPEECNPNWSWTNQTSNNRLRIYIKGDAEMAFLQLAFPVDQ